MSNSVEIGEITAYRGWLLLPDFRLRSLWAKTEWQPGYPMHGDINAVHKTQVNRLSPVWYVEGGVYAWKEETQAREYAKAISLFGLAPGVIVETNPDPLIVIGGKVMIYGRVAIHQHGYRAEHAVITSIYVENAYPPQKPDVCHWYLAKLNERYLRCRTT